MSVVVDTLTARLEADTASFTSGMSQAQGQLSRMDVALAHLQNPTAGVTRGLREVEGSIRMMAAQSLGATGPVGSLASGLLMLTGGGALMLGVSAGLAGLGLIIKALTDEFNRASKAATDAQHAFESVGAAEGPNVGIAQRLMEAQQQLTDAQDHLAKAQQRVRDQMAGSTAERFATQTAEKWAQAVATLTSEVNDLTIALTHSHKELRDNATVLEREVASAMVETTAVLERAAGTIAAIPFVIGPLKLETALGTDKLPDGVKAITKDMVKAAKDLQTEFGNALLSPGAQKSAIEELAFRTDEKLSKDMARAGRDAAQALIEGLIQGTQDLAALLENAILQFVVGSFLDVISGILNPGAGKLGFGGGGAGGTPPHPKFSQASFSLETSGVPAPRTPFDVMRDAEWQKALRGSLLYAYSQGFKR